MFDVAMADLQRDNHHLVGNAGGKVLRLRIGDIQWVQASRNYVQLRLSGGLHKMRATLGDVYAAVGQQGFVQIHRSVLVNRAFVAGVRREGGRLQIVVSGGSVLPVSRSYADQVLRELSPPHFA